jgi:hypothetical protein
LHWFKIRQAEVIGPAVGVYDDRTVIIAAVDDEPGRAELAHSPDGFSVPVFNAKSTGCVHSAAVSHPEEVQEGIARVRCSVRP